jgi:hypothetical protein
MVVSAAAIGLFVGLIPPQPRVPDHKQFERAEDQKWTVGRECQPQELARIKPGPSKQDRADKCAQEAERYREEREERWQTIRAAGGAQESAAYAWHQALIADATAAILLLALGASFWAAMSAVRAAEAADDTLKHQQETSERELRAYVFLEDVEFSWDKRKKEWGAQFSYRNSGHTPAYDVVVSSGVAYRKTVDSDSDWTPQQSYAIGIMGPNKDKFFDEAYFDEQIGGYQAVRASLRDGSYEAFLFGRIDYIDDFGRKRWTSFRYSVGGEVGYDDFEMNACKDGNATEWSETRSDL